MMRKTLATLAAVLGAALVLAPLASASLINDGGYTSYNAYQINAGGTLAQTFTPSRSGTLVEAQLPLQVVGNPGSTTVGIYATSGGLPTGSALDSTTLQPDQITGTTVTPTDVVLPAPGAPIVGGQTYAIVLGAGPDLTDYVEWGGDVPGDPSLPADVNQGTGWQPEVLTLDFEAEIDAPPSVTAPGNVSVPATGASGATVDYSGATATDAFGNALTPTCQAPSGSDFGIGQTTVTCTATDAYGQSGSGQFTVTVTAPTTPPTISGASNVSEPATSANGAAVSYPLPTATDAFGNAATVGCSPGSGSTFAIGKTTVNCSAYDPWGNVSSRSFSVTVTPPTTAPTLAGASDVTAQAPSSGGTPVTYATPEATDVFGDPAQVACAPGSGTTFPVGTTLVTCTATDAYGNSKSETFNVIVAGAVPQGGAPAPPAATPAAQIATITIPANGATYRRGTSLRAVFDCSDASGAPGISSCTGSKTNGSRLDTTQPGVHTFTVTALSSDGQVTRRTVKYTIEVPSNHFTAVRLKPLANGTIDVTLRVPGPGTVDALVTAWKDNFAEAASLLQPAAGRLATARTRATARRGGVITLNVAPNASGRKLVLHHTYAVTLRAWITFTPTGGFQRSKGWYGLTLP
jgi:hypothetical protein